MATASATLHTARMLCRRPRLLLSSYTASAAKRGTASSISSSFFSSSARAPQTNYTLSNVHVTKCSAADAGRSLSSVAAAEEPAVCVPITYIYPDGEEVEVQAEVGKHLLDVAHDNDVNLEGACGGELACATCHLIFEQDVYDKLPEKMEEEDDMLDLAYELTDTSRLGCQITVTEDMAGMRVRVPEDGL